MPASGITVHSSPSSQSPIPCYNEHWAVADSSNYLSAGFKYTIICEDVISGETRQFQRLPSLTGNLEFNSQFFAEEFMGNFLPINQYGWKKCTGAVRKIRVNIGETYNSAGYVAGSDIFYNTWNAALEVRTFAGYNVSNYCYDGTIPNRVFLTAVGATDTYEDRSEYLFAIVQEGNTADIPSIEILTYNAAGSIIGQYTIDRPDYSTGIYTDQYFCIDIGYKGLNNINPLLYTVVSGSASIITPAVASYKIYDNSVPSLIKTVTIKCEPQFDVYTLHYLKRKGGFDTLHCPKVAELTSDKTITTAKKNNWVNVSNVMTFDTNVPVEKVVTTISKDKIRVNSDWLTQAEFTRHKDLFTSPKVYVDLGASSNYIPVKLSNTSYITKNNDRLRNLVFDLEFTNDNNSQRG